MAQHTDRWLVKDVLNSQFQITANNLEGTFGYVYIVLDLEDKVLLAAKTFKNEFLRNKKIIDLFFEEAKTWVNLERNENIVNALFVQNVRGKPCIFMEYVEGATLGYFIRSHSLDEEQSIDFAIQFCSGMAHAKSKIPQIVHRDIKPDNVLIHMLTNTVKIGDWGIAKTKVELGKDSFGTPQYMSPEQFINYRDVDERSDIYSFGVMFYEMLTYRLPFNHNSLKIDGKTLYDCYEKLHFEESPELISKINSNIPKPLADLIMSCLEKNPNNRPPNFHFLKNELINQYGKKHETILKPNTKNERYWVNKAASLTALRRFEEALEACNEALKYNKNSVRAWVNKSIAYKNLQMHKEALFCLNEALKIDTNDEIVWNNKGNTLMDLGLKDDALEAYNKAISLKNDYDKAWNNKGWLLLNLFKKYEQATECFDKAIQYNPSYDTAWNNKGVAYSHLQQYSKAIECFNSTLEINPRSFFALLNIGAQLISLNKVSEAIEQFDMALEIAPNYYHALNSKGVALRALGKFDEALDYFDKAINEGIHYEEG